MLRGINGNGPPGWQVEGERNRARRTVDREGRKVRPTVTEGESPEAVEGRQVKSENHGIVDFRYSGFLRHSSSDVYQYTTRLEQLGMSVTFTT